MIRKLFVLICLLLLCSTVLSAGITEKLKQVVAQKSEAAAGWNPGLASDANLVAHYKLDNGALTTDTSGGNTLTNSGVVADTGTYKEGDAAGTWANLDADYMSVDDSNLDADHPWKSGVSGDWSLSLWVYPTDDPSNGSRDYIVDKYDTSGSNRSFNVVIYGESGGEYIRTCISVDGGASGTCQNHGSDLALEGADYWIYVTVTWNETDDDLKVRIYNASCTQIGSEQTVDLAANMNRSTTSFFLGAEDGTPVDGIDGNLDEVLIFKDIISDAESQSLCGGTY